MSPTAPFPPTAIANRRTLAPAVGAAVLDALPLAVVHADRTDRILYVNREFFAITECTPGDLAHMNFQDVLSLFCLGMSCEPDAEGRIRCPEDQWLAVEQYIRTSAGGSAWVRVRLSTFADEAGPVRQLLVEDVSQYKDIIDLLSPGRRRPEPARRADPVCGFLPNWALTFANQSFLRTVRVTREALVTRDFLSLMPPASREACRAAVENITLERPVAEVECRMLGCSSEPRDMETPPQPHDPSERWMRWIIQAFFYKTGHVKDFQAFGMDITEQKRAESRYIHTDRLASLGAMVSGVAHEVNNPNNVIMLNAPLLLDLWSRVEPVLQRLAETSDEAVDEATAPAGAPGPAAPPALARPSSQAVRSGSTESAGAPGPSEPPDHPVPSNHLDPLDTESIQRILEDVPELLHGVLSGAERIKHIVAELKNFGRQDVGRDFELVSLNDVAQSAVSLMRRTIEHHTERFSLRLAVCKPLLMGRRRRLEQVVVNLLHNACLALERRDQAIVVQVLQDEASGSAILEVRDEGVGIPHAALPRVTDPFYSTRHAEDGAGLGLAISLGIVREHGGSLEIESPPRGSHSSRGVAARAIFPLAE